MSTSPHEAGRIRRRTVVSASAWSVPAVIVAGAAPAMAASPAVTVTAVSACLVQRVLPFTPYQVVLSAANPTAADVTVTATGIDLRGDIVESFASDSFSVPAGSTDTRATFRFSVRGAIPSVLTLVVSYRLGTDETVMNTPQVTLNAPSCFA